MKHHTAHEFDLRLDVSKVVVVPVPGALRLTYFGDGLTGQVTLVLSHHQADELRSEIEQELRPAAAQPVVNPSSR